MYNRFNSIIKTFFVTVAGIFLIVKSDGQTPYPNADKVNVFLGSSGDHGQLSPAASYPFSMLGIGPQTYPNTHTGYEYKAKLFLGFTHNRFEGVGCRGSGGNILIKPYTGNASSDTLLKVKEAASPAFYTVSFLNGITASFTVNHNAGIEEYFFPKGKNGFTIDLSHTLANGFIGESHTISGNAISGWIESGTTCREGAYRVYYYLTSDEDISWQNTGEHLVAGELEHNKQKATIRIAFSAVDTSYAKAAINKNFFAAVKDQSRNDWNKLLGKIEVKGNTQEAGLFYSLLYRTLQSPYIISEKDGSYRANNGTLQTAKDPMFNGWAIWDNYRTQLPLLSLVYPAYYKNIVSSLAGLYRFGKKNWATLHEPSNSVRTEHAIVVLLDAQRKNYAVDFPAIIDSLKRETDSLDFTHPDKALESSYDTWALSEIYGLMKNETLSKKYKEKAADYKLYWEKDFKSLTKNDVDKMGARGMYQGTIWQYRWLVPYDVKGLIELCGGDKAYRNQLDDFFAKDFYSATNETDIQVPAMYNASSQPWKSQNLITRYAKDTVVQFYTDVNVRGVDPIIERVFNNRPEAFIRSMDDDAGAMSAWYIFAASGITQACVGYPVYYLHVPLFEKITFKEWGFTIELKNYGNKNRYIKSASLNGKLLDRNWISHDEIIKGGSLIIEASETPNPAFGLNNQWITDLMK